jgi:hypothetical protein
VQAVPNGLKRGMNIVNVTPEPVRPQKTHLGHWGWLALVFFISLVSWFVW